MGFGAGTGVLYSKYREPGHGPRTRTTTHDTFEANQRVRLQLDAGPRSRSRAPWALRSATSALVNQWQIYENLELNLELGSIVNMRGQDTWQKSGSFGSFEKQDARKAQLTFAYSF